VLLQAPYLLLEILFIYSYFSPLALYKSFVGEMCLKEWNYFNLRFIILRPGTNKIICLPSFVYIPFAGRVY
jgi:hypothetical protein